MNSELFYHIGSLIYLLLAALSFGFGGGWMAKRAYEFFMEKDPNAWPFPKNLIQIYKWGGKINYDIDSLYVLEGKPRSFGLVKLESISWKRVMGENGICHNEVEMVFAERPLEEVTIFPSQMTDEEFSKMNYYCVANTLRMGRPVRIFDANGKEYQGCIECYVKEGRVRLRDKDDKMKVEWLSVPAPLKVIELKNLPESLKVVEKTAPPRVTTANCRCTIKGDDSAYRAAMKKAAEIAGVARKVAEDVEKKIMGEGSWGISQFVSPVVGLGIVADNTAKESTWAIVSPNGRVLDYIIATSEWFALFDYTRKNEGIGNVNHLKAVGYRAHEVTNFGIFNSKEGGRHGRVKARDAIDAMERFASLIGSGSPESVKSLQAQGFYAKPDFNPTPIVGKGGIMKTWTIISPKGQYVYNLVSATEDEALDWYAMNVRGGANGKQLREWGYRVIEAKPLYQGDHHA